MLPVTAEHRQQSRLAESQQASRATRAAYRRRGVIVLVGLCSVHSVFPLSVLSALVPGVVGWCGVGCFVRVAKCYTPQFIHLCCFARVAKCYTPPIHSPLQLHLSLLLSHVTPFTNSFLLPISQNVSRHLIFTRDRHGRPSIWRGWVAPATFPMPMPPLFLKTYSPHFPSAALAVNFFLMYSYSYSYSHDYIILQSVTPPHETSAFP